MGKENGENFNNILDITQRGNFEGKNIPNLLKGGDIDDIDEGMLSRVYEYRRKRCRLHTDDKILTSWNGLMISAMCMLYRVSRNEKYLSAAKSAESFIGKDMLKNGELYAGWREGKLGSKGFLDDYANYILALLSLYDATLDSAYIEKAIELLHKAREYFEDDKGGFFLYGNNSEQLITRPKECYDGAVPSGNSILAYAMTRLYLYDYDGDIKETLEKQLKFIRPQADRFPMGHAVYLTALSQYLFEPAKVTVSVKDRKDIADLVLKIPLDTVVSVADAENSKYPLKNDKTTYYICKNSNCLPPSNSIDDFE